MRLRLLWWSSERPAVLPWAILLSVALLAAGDGVRQSLSALVVDYVYAPFLAMKYRITSGATIFEENRNLQQRVAEMSVDNQRLRELASENARLRQLLLFSESWSARAIAAEVVGPVSSGSGIMWINAGRWRNVEVGWPVVTEDGLVGRVVDVTDRLSRVRTLWDRVSRVSTYNRRSRVAGIVSWESGPNLQLTYVLPSADIQIGDTLVSSGWGGTFPKGLQVGTIAEIDTVQIDIYLSVKVQPFAQANRLEHVFVIRPDNSDPGMIPEDLQP